MNEDEGKRGEEVRCSLTGSEDMLILCKNPETINSTQSANSEILSLTNHARVKVTARDYFDLI